MRTIASLLHVSLIVGTTICVLTPATAQPFAPPADSKAAVVGINFSSEPDRKLME
jgi:hypothetical protein